MLWKWFLTGFINPKYTSEGNECTKYYYRLVLSNTEILAEINYQRETYWPSNFLNLSGYTKGETKQCAADMICLFEISVPPQTV